MVNAGAEWPRRSDKHPPVRIVVAEVVGVLGPPFGEQPDCRSVQVDGASGVWGLDRESLRNNCGAASVVRT
jgi:hypothetical protein